MKKTTQTKTLRKRSVAAEMVTPVIEEIPVAVNGAPKKFFVWLILLAILLGAGYFFFKNKSLVIAGTVNGKAITRWDLEKAMNDRYAKTTFDELTNYTLLNQLAAKNSVSVSDEDINKEYSATEERLGGKEALATTLQTYGLTEQRLRDDVLRPQLLQRKLSEKLFQVEVKDEEVAKFFNENKTLFPNKKFDEVKEDIHLNLVQEQLGQKFNTWFQEQRKNALVVSYLK